MTKDELVQGVQGFLENDNQLLAELYFILKEGDQTHLRLIDIDEDTQKELTSQFIMKVKQDILEDDQLDVISISNADDRRNVIYEYDLDETPKELLVIDEIIRNDELPTFNFKNDQLTDIRGIVILISKDGQNLVLYKKHYPISLIKKDSGISLKRLGNNQRFTSLEDDVVKISISFEFFKFGQSLFIKDLKTLEKFFGFHEIIKQKAELCIEEIERSGILDNPEELKGLVDDISFSRKMTKVLSSSPVLNKIPSPSIISFVETHPSLKGSFEFNADKSKISLRTKKSKRLFVKLLNDDFLHSELTKLYYDSLAKDSLEETAV